MSSLPSASSFSLALTVRDISNALFLLFPMNDRSALKWNSTISMPFSKAYSWTFLSGA